MDKAKKIILVITLMFLSVATCFAAEDEESSAKPKAKLKDPAEFQKVVDEYKEYVSKIPPKIRDEIIGYRKEVAKLNKEKKVLYKKLSQEAQDYLKKEQQYKKKLPMDRKNLVTLDQGEEKK